ncbi:UB2R2 enzyme, partial [Atractosteus spatula]|nr:UB2R2 enzyme [Atractosteus spatula]
SGIARSPVCVSGSARSGPVRRVAMAQQQMPSSQKALMLELKSLQEEPVEGFRITLVEESDLYNWEVAIFGPPNTLYEGGYFKVSQPRVAFPRCVGVHSGHVACGPCVLLPQNGDVCISILHPPVDDPQSGELPSERWNPTQNVRAVRDFCLTCVRTPCTRTPLDISLDLYRLCADHSQAFFTLFPTHRKQVLATKAEAEKDGVKVPTTLAEYCIQTKVPSHDSSSDLLYDDLYDDDMEEEEEEEEAEAGEAGEGDCYDDEDSGNEES